VCAASLLVVWGGGKIFFPPPKKRFLNQYLLFKYRYIKLVDERTIIRGFTSTHTL